MRWQPACGCKYCNVTIVKNMKILRNILFILSLTLFICCEDVKEYPWNDAWNDKEHTEPEEPETPEEPQDPETPEEPENPETPEGEGTQEQERKEPTAEELLNYTVAELMAYAEEREIDLQGRTRKADIYNIIVTTIK